MSARERLADMIRTNRADLNLYTDAEVRDALDAHHAQIVAELNAEKQGEPLGVSRFDVAIEPAPEDEPILTIGAIAEDGRPVALFLDEETRSKVAGWLEPNTADALAQRRVQALDEGITALRKWAHKDGVEFAIGVLMSVRDDRDTADEAADFFRPGHTYVNAEFPEHQWKFRCDSVTTHPEDGERTALGWRFFNGEWDAIAYGEADWEIHQLVGLADVTEGGDQ